MSKIKIFIKNIFREIISEMDRTGFRELKYVPFAEKGWKLIEISIFKKSCLTPCYVLRKNIEAEFPFEAAADNGYALCQGRICTVGWADFQGRSLKKKNSKKVYPSIFIQKYRFFLSGTNPLLTSETKKCRKLKKNFSSLFSDFLTESKAVTTAKWKTGKIFLIIF
jgi:hypothetical protein